jgi:hypothetical protein
MESATYSEARVEYQKQMANKLVQPLLEFFRKTRANLWSESQQFILSRFQKKIAEIPKWNSDVVAEETTKLVEASRCDYLEELMTALFIAHTKVMASVRVNKKNKKLTITVPKLDHFLHRLFTEAAKSFWKAPFLFQDEGLTSIERQKNLLQAEAIIEEAIYAAVRDMLPIKKILQEYISEPTDDEDVVTNDIEAPASITDANNVEVATVEPVEAITPIPVEAITPIPVEPVVAPVPVAPVPVAPVSVVAPVPVVAPVSVAPPALVVSEPDIKNIPITSTEVPKIQKEETPASIKIDTEPAVQFSEMVSVFDERKSSVGEMRSIENPLDRPSTSVPEDDEDELLHIGQEVGGLDSADAEDLDNPGAGGIDDFETLE